MSLRHEFELDTEPLISPFSWKNPKARFTYLVLAAALFFCFVAIVVLASTRQRYQDDTSSWTTSAASTDPATTVRITVATSPLESEFTTPAMLPETTTQPAFDPMHEQEVQLSCFQSFGHEKECKNMGCMWQDHQVPQCYRHQTFSRYFIVEQQRDSLLLRTVSSKFSNQVQEVQVTISVMQDQTVRLTMEDANLKRWQVPLPMLNLTKIARLESTIRYAIKRNVLSIFRKESGAVIFQTDLSQLVMTQTLISMQNMINRDSLIGLGPSR